MLTGQLRKCRPLKASLCVLLFEGAQLLMDNGQTHLLPRIRRIVVGPCLILIKNSFYFIVQQFIYPNNMHFQNDRNIPIRTERSTAVVDGLQEPVKVILVIKLNLNLLSVYWHSLTCFVVFLG
jgi:hypothetical protein